MKTIKIRLEDVMAVKELVNLVSRIPCPVTIQLEDSVADAKSIMSIFALDLTKEFDLTVHGEVDPRLMEELAPFKA